MMNFRNNIFIIIILFTFSNIFAENNNSLKVFDKYLKHANNLVRDKKFSLANDVYDEAFVSLELIKKRYKNSKSVDSMAIVLNNHYENFLSLLGKVKYSDPNSITLLNSKGAKIDTSYRKNMDKFYVKNNKQVKKYIRKI